MVFLIYGDQSSRHFTALSQKDIVGPGSSPRSHDINCDPCPFQGSPQLFIQRPHIIPGSNQKDINIRALVYYQLQAVQGGRRDLDRSPWVIAFRRDQHRTFAALFTYAKTAVPIRGDGGFFL